MDTQTLKTFLTVSSLKSFTKTAEVLFVAQSTVTNRIADLEREIGKKLFTRDKKTIKLTKEGELFLSYAKRILELEEQSIREVNSFCYANNLHIGSTNTIYECHLYHKLLSFMITHSDTSVKLTLGHSNDLFRMLFDGVMDVIYTYVPLNKAGFICTPCYEDSLILVTSSVNQAYANGIHQNELCELNYLMCDFALQEVGVFIRKLFPDYYQFSFEIDNSTKVLRYLLDGFGYSFLPYHLVKEDLAQRKLCSIPLLDFETPKITSYCIHQKDKKIIQQFLDYS